MKRLLLALLLSTVFSLTAIAGDYSQQQNWVTSETITANKLNIDIQGLISTVNDLDNINIANSAAIAYSKLNLTGNIVSADMSGTAGITGAQILDDTITVDKLTSTAPAEDGYYPKYNDSTNDITWVNIMPSGIIVMWNSTVATIPTGWFLCDGTNSTPDLRNKFIIGAQEDDTVAKTNVTGSLTQEGGDVSHIHGGVTGSTGPGGTQAQAGSNHNMVLSHTHTIDSDDHLPPYYALCFIMKE